MINRATFPADRESRYRHRLEDIARSGWRYLSNGGEAVVAVRQAVEELEDCEWFNAGRGSVLTADGIVENDAAIMCGRDASVGAVAALSGYSNPIAVAEAIRREGTHILLAGSGAARFAENAGFESIDPSTLIVDERVGQLRAAIDAGAVSLDHEDAYGTVGAVARDMEGNLAAASSTGGMTNQHPGRVGDTPLIGSGLWADNSTCAVAATGHGEFFMRSVISHQIHARMRFGLVDHDTACVEAVNEVAERGGRGGVISIDRAGNISLPFTTNAMYRAWIDERGTVRSAVFLNQEGLVDDVDG